MSLSFKPKPIENVEDEGQSNWIQLKDPGFGSCTNPVKINSDKFIIGELDGMFIDTDCGIHQYSTTKNEWTKLSAYPKEYIAHKPSMLYDYETQKIWMIGDGNSEILEFDYTKPDNFNIIKYDNLCVGAHPNILLIKGEYHIIFGSDNRRHLVYKSTKGSCHPIMNILFRPRHTICDDYDHGLENAKCVYIESKRQILTFGGNDYGNQHRIVHKYSFYEDKWSKLAIMPLKCSGFGCILTRDERYVILFGIKDLQKSGIGAIYVFDVEKINFKESPINCPQMYIDYHAVLMGNIMEDELLVFGWLKTDCSECNIYLPIEMMNLIVRWTSIEWVHLLSKAQGHWKIPVKQIIESVQ